MNQNYEKIEELKSSVNHEKDELRHKYYKLLEIGAKKEANELEKIIIKLEIWQNK
jgi:hypothetical protein